MSVIFLLIFSREQANIARAQRSFRTPWYVSMHLDELNRTISGRPGFEHFERSYSSAVHWPRGTMGCTLFSSCKLHII